VANTNYLDELDGLLDNPNDSIIDIPPAAHHAAATTQPTNTSPAQEARDTWAAVIENASYSLQEGARTVQDAAYKNLELAKNQNENIKELIDAASGWRHATRQAVQEVASAKKNVILLTVISGIIAVAGFGTTIGVMLQSRSGLANMSNAVLENVDEHQTLVSRTLTLKMDEMAATIERMEGVIDQLAPTDAAKTQAKAPTADNTTNTEADGETIIDANNALPDMVLPVEKNIIAETPKTLAPTEVAATAIPATTPLISPTVQATASTTQLNDAVVNATAPLNKQMSEKLTQVTGQLTQLEQNWKQSDATLQKQLALIPNAVEEKLTPRLQALQKSTPTTTIPTATGTTTVISQDNKAVLEQLTRLRQDMAEIRQLQTVLKDQIGQLKQGQQSREPVPYQYRNPEVERYPH
jgi:hypothetical protein